MKKIFSILKVVITGIALLVLLAGIALTVLGAFEMVLAFSHLQTADAHHMPALIGTGLLKAVDLFLMVIVFFVFSLGILVLFNNPEAPLPVKLPEWLRVKNFVQLKVVLWEAILTTLVVSYLVDLAEKKMYGIQINLQSLIVPGAIFLIAL